MKILEDAGDLDCGGSCKVETTIHVPRSNFKLHENLEPQSAEAGQAPAGHSSNPNTSNSFIAFQH